jgi:hydroxymethylbilane synthase
VESRELLRSIVHRPTELRCTAERAFLRVLEGGCTVPVGANSEITSDDTLTLTGTVTAITGEVHVEHTLTERVASKEEAAKLGERLARIIADKGARQILEDVARDRAARGAEGAQKTKQEIEKIEGTAPETQPSV